MSLSTFAKMIEESYDLMGLAPRDRVKFDLICRYQDKVSPRLLQVKADLQASVKGFSKAYMADLITKPSWIDSIDLKNTWENVYLPIPISFGEEESE